MNPAHLVASVTESGVADADSAVVWAGDHEGRRGVRMRQTVRDMTTVWFDTRERTVTIEAYVLPRPPRRADEVYRQALRRNAGMRRMAFALDDKGDLVLTGKIPVEALTEDELELALGEIYEAVEVSFRAFVAAGFGREKNT